MENCKLTIVTTVDGEQNRILREGEFIHSFLATEIRYREENAFVVIRINGKEAEIERQGDYSLRLRLEEGKTCEGSIGIGGNEGEILACATKIEYTFKENSFLLTLEYHLLIGKEKQEMKLRIMAMLGNVLKREKR